MAKNSLFEIATELETQAGYMKQLIAMASEAVGKADDEAIDRALLLLLCATERMQKIDAVAVSLYAANNAKGGSNADAT